MVMMTMMMMMMMIVGTYGDYSSKSVLVSITTLTYEQKGCREKSRGTKDQLPIDRVILRDSKKKKTNLAIACLGGLLKSLRLNFLFINNKKTL